MSYTPPFRTEGTPNPQLGFIVAAGLQMMGFGALPVSGFANPSAGGPFYDVRLLSETGSAVRSSLGISEHIDAFRRCWARVSAPARTNPRTPMRTEVEDAVRASDVGVAEHPRGTAS